LFSFVSKKRIWRTFWGITVKGLLYSFVVILWIHFFIGMYGKEPAKTVPWVQGLKNIHLKRRRRCKWSWVLMEMAKEETVVVINFKGRSRN